MSWMYRAYTTNRSISPRFLGGVPAEAVHRDRSDLQDYAVLSLLHHAIQCGCRCGSSFPRCEQSPYERCYTSELG